MNIHNTKGVKGRAKEVIHTCQVLFSSGQPFHYFPYFLLYIPPRMSPRQLSQFFHSH